jgi:hypothetical protein
MKVHIGIDPDVDRSGVTEWYPATKQLVINSLAFFDLLGRLQSLKTAGCDIHVVLEAGWLNKSHWHVGANDNRFIASAKGNSTGRNHETGRKLEEMLKYLELSYELRRPRNHKVDADYFKKLTGYKGRTNQDERDSALLVFGI